MGEQSFKIGEVKLMEYKVTWWHDMILDAVQIHKKKMA